MVKKIIKKYKNYLYNIINLHKKSKNYGTANKINNKNASEL